MELIELNHLDDCNDPNDANHQNLSHEIYEVTAQRISSGPSKPTYRSSLITWPLDRKDIPCPEWVPIITASMIGGFTF